MSAEPKTTRKTPANRETFLFWAVYFSFLEFRNSSGFMQCGGSGEIFPETYYTHLDQCESSFDGMYTLGCSNSPFYGVFFINEENGSMDDMTDYRMMIP